MIRIVVATADAGMAANVGGPVHVTYRTFKVEAGELEAFMSEPTNSLYQRTIVGVEIEAAAGPPKDQQSL